MPLASAQPVRDETAGQGAKTAAIGWFVAASFYFYQYFLRSSPSVMMPQLSATFHLSVVSVASLVGLFYYGYAPFSLVAGAAMDRLGPQRILPIAAAVTGAGGLLFGTGSHEWASIGRLLQGAGGVFAPVGAIYIAAKKFQPSQAATLIGATQMFGMAGGAGGQFLVGPLVARGLSSNAFWTAIGVLGLVIGVLLFFFIPRAGRGEELAGDLRVMTKAFLTVFKNPQSILCGMIAGLLFIPTTIFDMVWGVRYLQEAHGFEYASAVIRTAMVPLGWIIGCPLLGFISDRLGRRKPVIIGGSAVLFACLAWILFGHTGVMPPYILGLAAGIASGAAMLPYTVIKEANPPEFGGTSTGVITFLNFTLSAMLGPVFTWMLQGASGGSNQLKLTQYQIAFGPLLVGVALAIVLAVFLRETGSVACES